MRSLPELQADFAAALLARGATPGLAAYRANVQGNWTKALAGAYPIVRKIVGPGFFERLARAYAREHRSTSGDLNDYGERLPRFVAQYAHTQDLPYLPDVARMEWLAHRAYFAADPKRPDMTSLLQEDPRSWSLRLAPACALMGSGWPLARIWAVHQDDYAGEVDVDLAAGPDRILVHRPLWRVEVRSLAPGDFRFLEALGAGHMLEEALVAGAADPRFDPASVLARWIAAGVIVP